MQLIGSNILFSLSVCACIFEIFLLLLLFIIIVIIPWQTVLPCYVSSTELLFKCHIVG